MSHDALIPPFERMLAALSVILAKAEAHCTARKIAPEVLLTFRLYPDMLPFTRQVQLTCDFCVRAASRLSGAAVPSTPDTETTFAELEARIAAARAHLAAIPPEALEGCDTREVSFPMRGQTTTMSGLTFRTLFAMPQVYFHATTAYAILRHNGVEVGKGDFMGV